MGSGVSEWVVMRGRGDLFVFSPSAVSAPCGLKKYALRLCGKDTYLQLSKCAFLRRNCVFSYVFFVIQDEGWLFVLRLRVFCVRVSVIFAKLRLLFMKLLRLK